MSSAVVREEPPYRSDDRLSLEAWLDYHRATLLQKCDGLTGEQLATASVSPSNLTLLGLLQHMSLVEWWWFEHIFADESTPEPFDTGGDPEWEFTHLDPSTVESMKAAFEAQCNHSRAIVAAARDLDQCSTSPERTTRDLRWILVHMIEEYARHNGHADLLREAIDGVVGD